MTTIKHYFEDSNKMYEDMSAGRSTIARAGHPLQQFLQAPLGGAPRRLVTGDGDRAKASAGLALLWFQSLESRLVGCHRAVHRARLAYAGEDHGAWLGAGPT